jgi:hypothetical protein
MSNTRPAPPLVLVWHHHQPHLGERLTIRTHCPGTVSWTTGDEPTREQELIRTEGALAGAGWYQASIGPFAAAGTARFAVRCTRPGCDCRARCCLGPENLVLVLDG